MELALTLLVSDTPKRGFLMRNNYFRYYCVVKNNNLVKF